MTAANDPPPDLTQREAYLAWTTEKLRYCDTDRQGHVNNTVFAALCEAGRVHMLMGADAPPLPPGLAFVIARLILDFRAELTWPGVVDVGTGVLSIGNSSFRLGQGIFGETGCAATAETVIVLTDTSTRRSTPLTPELRATLDGLKL